MILLVWYWDQSPCLGLRRHLRPHRPPFPLTAADVFSETVLEFELPPLPEWDTLPIGAEVYGEFVVSNDGKNFSNAMPFTYINLVDNFPPPIFNSSL